MAFRCCVELYRQGMLGSLAPRLSPPLQNRWKRTRGIRNSAITTATRETGHWLTDKFQVLNCNAGSIVTICTTMGALYVALKPLTDWTMSRNGYTSSITDLIRWMEKPSCTRKWMQSLASQTQLCCKNCGHIGPHTQHLQWCMLSVCYQLCD